ncbi:MAG: zinc ABC transporter substrate-binding protein [Candidatus Zixiibacteriota bacterium]|nr:MAG: zinc ABC transporter substrate-binding protein [candidate division Zixibacteria bacterium]
MKTKVSALIILFLLLVTSGCRTASNRGEAERKVVTTFLPVHAMTLNVTRGVPGQSVEMLLEPNAGCPHDYMLNPTQAGLLEKADVLVMNGLGMEQFLEGKSFLQRPGLTVIRAGEAVDPLPLGSRREEDHHGHDHEPGDDDVNPHAWVSPFEAAKMTRYLGEQLARVDSAHADQYRANAAAYAARLDSLGQAFRELVAGASNRRIVTFHPAFDYLARDIGLEIPDVILTDAGAEPSARGLSELAAHLRQYRPAGIFSEPQYSDRLARTLAEETGVPLYELDPAATGPADPGAYLEIMGRNYDTLRRALYPGEE